MFSKIKLLKSQCSNARTIPARLRNPAHNAPAGAWESHAYAHTRECWRERLCLHFYKSNVAAVGDGCMVGDHATLLGWGFQRKEITWTAKSPLTHIMSRVKGPKG